MSCADLIGWTGCGWSHGRRADRTRAPAAGCLVRLAHSPAASSLRHCHSLRQASSRSVRWHQPDVHAREACAAERDWDRACARSRCRWAAPLPHSTLVSSSCILISHLSSTCWLAHPRSPANCCCPATDAAAVTHPADESHAHTLAAAPSSRHSIAARFDADSRIHPFHPSAVASVPTLTEASRHPPPPVVTAVASSFASAVRQQPLSCPHPQPAPRDPMTHSPEPLPMQSGVCSRDSTPDPTPPQPQPTAAAVAPRRRMDHRPPPDSTAMHWRASSHFSSATMC